MLGDQQSQAIEVGAVPVEHAEGGVAVLPVFQQCLTLLCLHRVGPIPPHFFHQNADEPVLAHQIVVRGVAEAADILAALALVRIGEQQLLEDRGVRRIGDDAARDTAIHLPAQRNPPGDRAAPVVADNGECLHAQRIGQLENIADQLVRAVGIHILRLGRPAVAALVWGDATEPVGEMGDLVAPGPVAFGKAVKEDERGRVLGSFIDHIQLDSVGEPYPCLFHRHPSPSILSM